MAFQRLPQQALKMVLETRTTSPKKVTNQITVPKSDPKLQFGLGKFAFSLLPLTPESQGRRKTILTEVVKGQIWTLDQLQGIINVNVPVRSTVIKLSNGDLFVNNPVAPTQECIQMIRDLESQYGPVKYITLSSLALEHKGTAGAFSSYFPQTKIYYQPGQYSFPVDLPPFFFFPLGRSIQEIPRDFKSAPWGDEIEHFVLGPLKPPQIGGFGETAFFHKATNTLLVTDSIVRVDDEPPAIVQEDPRALLYHARDDMFSIVEDTPANRRKGWRRMVLFGLTFQPSGIEISDLVQAVRDTSKVSPDMKLLGRGTIPLSEGLYPWKWVRSEIPNFKALQGGLLVAPILQKLIFNREPAEVLDWADKVSKWSIKRIIPCHLANDIKASGQDFRKAFRFLEASPSQPTNIFSSLFGGLQKSTTNTNTSGGGLPQVREEDLSVLNSASEILTKSGVIKPEAPPVVRSKK